MYTDTNARVGGFTRGGSRYEEVTEDEGKSGDVNRNDFGFSSILNEAGPMDKQMSKGYTSDRLQRSIKRRDTMQSEIEAGAEDSALPSNGDASDEEEEAQKSEAREDIAQNDTSRQLDHENILLLTDEEITKMLLDYQEQTLQSQESQPDEGKDNNNETATLDSNIAIDPEIMKNILKDYQEQTLQSQESQPDEGKDNNNETATRDSSIAVDPEIIKNILKHVCVPTIVSVRADKREKGDAPYIAGWYDQINVLTRLGRVVCPLTNDSSESCGIIGEEENGGSSIEKNGNVAVVFFHRI
eukprot:CAMPEP_0195539600 /NCGR_PEP_ID=MMETSP0794_2-20130614/50138_1 /TAXON_ID=515487 /ORGANISM="Stephanopyxis turris, Strain CCMP 815" /LENGTH=298 /DNA_ID=CAMNT_0040673639 /DNA_START=333 /DNA_END=1228 /DNA_ORIENTATION=-